MKEISWPWQPSPWRFSSCRAARLLFSCACLGRNVLKVVAAGSALAASGPLGLQRGSVHAQQPVTLSFWSEWSGDPQRTAIGKLIDQFNTANPNITIEHRPIENEEFFTVLRTGFTSGARPDIFSTRDTTTYSSSRTLARSNRLMTSGRRMAIDSFREPTHRSRRATRTSACRGPSIPTRRSTTTISF